MRDRPEIVSHTSFRGLAALLVVIFHYRSFLDNSIQIDQFTGIFGKGYIWVDFFFMLSGFILCYVYLLDSNKPRFNFAIREFYLARLARIFPLHILTLSFVILFFLSLGMLNTILSGNFCCLWDDHFRSVDSLIANIFLVHAWSFYDIPTWNIPSWSISAEFACYLAFGIYLWLAKYRANLLRFIVPAFGALLYFYLLTLSSSIDEHFHLSVPRALAGFSTGIGIYHLRAINQLTRIY